jgi:tRNA-Thr(GGU) m(6)t(6)A37 methyltransferase TsaA
MSYLVHPIAYVQSPYKTKFGAPRQPGLVPSIEMVLVFEPPYDQPDAFRGLEGFSHIWVQFYFHQTATAGWQALVKPPRLGGQQKMGVFATRSTHRPNPLGLSLLKIVRIELTKGCRIVVSGADLIEGTPVLDIKPYIPFVEAKPEACSGYIDGPPPVLRVYWTAFAQNQAQSLAAMRQMAAINEVLAQDPRPAYHNDPNRLYGLDLFDLTVRFSVDDGTVWVKALEKCAHLSESRDA